MEQEIRDRHNALEGMISTQSVKIVNEAKSQAHRDRGELLKVIGRLKTELIAERKRSQELLERLAEHEAPVIQAKEVNGEDTRPDS